MPTKTCGVVANNVACPRQTYKDMCYECTMGRTADRRVNEVIKQKVGRPKKPVVIVERRGVGRPVGVKNSPGHKVGRPVGVKNSPGHKVGRPMGKKDSPQVDASKRGRPRKPIVNVFDDNIGDVTLPMSVVGLGDDIILHLSPI